jgi:hypothetical protein
MAFVVGTATVRLVIPEANSLKEKRSVLKSMLEGMRGRFNVSAAEVEDNDIWRRATIGIACAANSRQFADEVLGKVLTWIEANPRVYVAGVQTEVL